MREKARTFFVLGALALSLLAGWAQSASAASRPANYKAFIAALSRPPRAQRPLIATTSLPGLVRGAPGSPYAVRSLLARHEKPRQTPPWPYCYRGTAASADGRCAAEVFTPRGGRPRGTVIVVSAGGWQSGPPSALAPGTPHRGLIWEQAGYQVILVEGTSGQVTGVDGLGPWGYTNYVQWYDLVRFDADRYLAATYPVCVAGGSSSGHSALLIGAIRTPSCIETEAAPTDLPVLLGFTTNAVYGLAVQAFGRRLAQWSPVNYRLDGTFPVAMATLPDDRLVAPDQMRRFAEGRKQVSAMTLSAEGPGASDCSNYRLYFKYYFTHLCLGGQQGVTPASLARWHHHELSILNAAVARPTSSVTRTFRSDRF